MHFESQNPTPITYKTTCVYDVEHEKGIEQEIHADSNGMLKHPGSYDKPTLIPPYRQLGQIYNRRKNQLAHHHNSYFGQPPRYFQNVNRSASDLFNGTDEFYLDPPMARWGSSNSIQDFANRHPDSQGVPHGRPQFCPVHRKLNTKHKSVQNISGPTENYWNGTQESQFIYDALGSHSNSTRQLDNIGNSAMPADFVQFNTMSQFQPIQSPLGRAYTQPTERSHKSSSASQPEYLSSPDTFSAGTADVIFPQMAMSPPNPQQGMMSPPVADSRGGMDFLGSRKHSHGVEINWRSNREELIGQPFRESIESGYSTQESLNANGFPAQFTNWQHQLTLEERLGRGCSVVLGGASTKGVIIAKRLLKKGITVIVVDVNSVRGESLVSGLVSKSPQSPILFKLCDVSQSDELKSCFEEIKDTFGHIEVMFNLVRDVNPQNSFEYQMSVNLSSKLQSTLMLKECGNNKSVAVLLTSSAGIYPEDNIVLNTSSSALIGFTRSFSRDSHLFRVNAVCAEKETSDELIASAMLKFADDRKRNGVVLLVTKSKGLKYIEPVTQ